MIVNIEKAYTVMVTINELGFVQYTGEYKTKIDNARNAYNGLNDAGKDLVKNYVVLSVAEQSYNRVDEAYNAIESIKKVKYNKSSRETIEDARRKYNTLDERERSLIPEEEEKLLKAEEKYEKAEHGHNVGMGWLAAICITFGIGALAIGVYFLILLILKKKREKEEEENKNNKKNKTSKSKK